MRFVAFVLAAAAVALPLRAQEPASFPWVLPWDDATKSLTDMRSLNDRPAGKHGFVRSANGHLATDKGRIRFLGVNICMDACFPEHSDARKVAARMAKFGINCVRFHHMDGSPSPQGILQPDMRTLDPAQVERLDYFIAELKTNGIYADLNLHVSRKYPAQPEWQGMPSFFKGVDNFQPEMIRLQHEYARALLTHYNPYTRSRYVSEPAVAFIEINNENSLVQEWGDGALDDMPAVYQDELRRQWNVWLRVHYASTAALRKAWDATDVPLGDEALKESASAWTLEQHGKAAARRESGSFGPNGETAHRVTVTQPGEADWHVQFNQTGIALKGGKPYTFTFWARCDTVRTISVNAMQAHEPWNDLWTEHLKLNGQWKMYSFVFRPSGSDDRARIGFGEMGSHTGVYEFAGLSLRPGGSSPMLRDAELGKADWFPHAGFSSLPEGARRDWVRFLWDTETAYWAGMRAYIKVDLKARALVIGSQVCNSPEPIQANMDIIDNHAYWKHPSFPNRPWDPVDWTVENVPMAGESNTGTLAGLAWRREFGKPYVVTEYNHPAPNSFRAETLPILSAYAALQDWDGVFLFDYCSSKSLWASGRIGGFFSIGNDPSKMATLPAAAAMFLRGDVAAGRDRSVRALTAGLSQESVASHGKYNAWGAPEGTDPLDAVRHRTGWTQGTPKADSHSAAPATPVVPARSDTGELAWAQTVTVNTPRTKAAIGPIPAEGLALGGIKVTGDGRPAVVALTIISGKGFLGPCRILLTAAADSRNTGMKWKDDSHTSVGSDWGTAPAIVDGVTARVSLPVPAARVKAWALDERGNRTHELKVTGGSGTAVVSIGPEYKTLWYEIAVG